MASERGVGEKSLEKTTFVQAAALVEERKLLGWYGVSEPAGGVFVPVQVVVRKAVQVWAWCAGLGDPGVGWTAEQGGG